MLPPPQIDWPVPGAFPALAPGHVHVWCAWLDAPDAAGPAAFAALSAEEQKRADAFHFAADRRRYVAAHAMLRQVLGRYLFDTVGGALRPDPHELRSPPGRKAPPAVVKVELIKGPSGKPALADGSLRFNLSHSGPLALLAVSRGLELGVDLEQQKELAELSLLEGRLFTPADLPRQQRLAPAMRLRSFYRRWTQWEAVGKCRGTGLDLDNLTPGTEHLVPLDPAEGYLGCLACEKNPALISLFRFSTEVLSLLPATTASTAPILPGLPHRLEGLASLSSG